MSGIRRFKSALALSGLERRLGPTPRNRMDVRRRRSIEGAHAGTAALPGLCSPSSLLSLPMTGLPMTAWSGAGVRRKPTSSVESSGGRVLLE